MAGAGTAAVRRAGAAGAVLAALLVWLPGTAQAVPGEAPGGWTLSAVTALPATTDYTDRTVTLTGRLRHGGTQDGSPQQPAAGATVDLVAGDPSGPGAQLLGTVRTGPGGAFLLPGARIGLRPAGTGAGPYTVPVHALHRTPGPGGGTYGAWDAEAEVDVTAVPSAVRLTAEYTLGAPAAGGRTVTAEGVVERAAGGGWVPVADAPVRIGYLPDGAASPVARTVRTGPDGHFGADVTATATGTASTALDAVGDPYLDASGAVPQTLRVAVAAPAPPSATAPAATTPPRRAAPAVQHRSTAPATTAPRSPVTSPTPSPAAPGAVEQPGSLAMTGPGGFTRAAFLTGGTTLITAGLLLAVARRRITRASAD